MSKSKSLKIRVLALGLGATLSLMAGIARADVLATSVLTLDNLLFSHTGGATLTTADFASISYQNSGDTSASFTGFATLTGTGNNTPLDLPLICVGSGCGGTGLTENGYQHLGVPATGNFAAADQLENGFPIGGLGTPVGATVDSGSWSQVKAPGGGNGSATSNNGLTASLTFVAAFTGTVDITADYDFFWQVAMSAGEAAASSTQSRGVTDFNLLDVTAGTPVFDFLPVGLNWNFSITGPRATDLVFGNTGSGSFSFTTPTLIAGHEYLLTATEQTLADVNRVPEPGSLALLGVGLLGLGLARRKGLAKKR